MWRLCWSGKGKMNAESGFAARAFFLPSFPIDLELLVAVAFVLLAALALVYAIFASYLCFRVERNNADRHVPVAIGLFGSHYFVFFGSRHLRGRSSSTHAPLGLNSNDAGIGDLARITGSVEGRCPDCVGASFCFGRIRLPDWLRHLSVDETRPELTKACRLLGAEVQLPHPVSAKSAETRVGQPHSLQLRVFRLGLLQGGNSRVGVFPEREEIFISRERADAGGVGFCALQQFRLQGVGAS